ncbi:MAG: CoA transferase [Burkholderiaceae bacterium]|nr:CoA transferase [Burkholderiaceae bacterium]
MPNADAVAPQTPPPDAPPAAVADGPLTGIRVIDLTAVVLGPMCTRELADFGADVIKIEPPAGDMMRSNGVSLHPGMSSIYLALNRNKRSVVLDLKTEAGRQALAKLIEGADVFIHNMRVPAIEKLGFGYAAVQRINPRIVYCAATAFGQEGPYRSRPAFDDVIQASCGLVGVNAIGHDTPAYIPSLIADKTTGLAVASAVLAALVCQQRHGLGQYVEVPMLETMTAFTLTEHMGGMTFPGNSTAPAGYARLLHGGRQPWPTADGWIALLPYTERHWRAFFTYMGREDLIEQYGIADRQRRNANIQKIYGELRHVTRTKTTAEWLAICDQIDVPCAPIYDLDELPAHPHLQAVKLFEQSQHPTEGPIRQVRPPARFSRTPTRVRWPAPSLGAHTAEVLAQAGIAEDAVAPAPPA